MLNIEIDNIITNNEFSFSQAEDDMAFIINKEILVEIYYYYLKKDFFLKKIELSIPSGFKTDLASIPRILWAIYPPFGKYTNASIIHDFLYSYLKKQIEIKSNCVSNSLNDIDKKFADLVFFKKMKIENVNKFTRYLFYLIVKFFGKCKKK